MKTYTIYSKKETKNINSIKDISALAFVKYGFNWLYCADVINILYSLKKRCYLAIFIIIVFYFIAPEALILQIIITLCFGFLFYELEILSLKARGYKIIGTVEAKNAKQARELFTKEYILVDCDGNKKSIFVKSS